MKRLPILREDQVRALTSSLPAGVRHEILRDPHQIASFVGNRLWEAGYEIVQVVRDPE